ncbi:MAG TPA: hypothetical protein VJM31_04530 [Vicinamibacterales bacterium]|nr:hypothetical protein [Vicinamibacterales bacterium]
MFEALEAAVNSQSTLAWAPLLTLLLLLAAQPWRAYMPDGTLAELLGQILIVLVVLALLVDGIAGSPWFWFVLTAALLLWISAAYFIADNHHYLIAYWCLAVGLALFGGPEGTRILRQSGALLIGLCFATAVASKLLNARYRDGSFFTWTLLSDPRFVPLATFIGGLKSDVRERHLVAMDRVRSGVSQHEVVVVPRDLRRLAMGLTWWTIGIETLVATVFLSPVNLELTRVVLLVVFAVTTFVFVAVPVFGQILLLILLACTDDVTIRVYIAVLALGLAVVSFIPNLAKRLTPLVHQSLVAQRRPTANGSVVLP